MKSSIYCCKPYLCNLCTNFFFESTSGLAFCLGAWLLAPGKAFSVSDNCLLWKPYWKHPKP